MSTPFERGLKKGEWTLEDVYELGFSTPEECLAYQEQTHQEDLATLARLRPELARIQAEYLEGIITATRASLKALMK